MDATEESKRLTISDNSKDADVGSPGCGEFSESAIVRQSRGFVSAFCLRFVSKVLADSTFEVGDVLSGGCIGQCR